ncbi:hypothetical protein [Frankia sp. CcI49]|uniref:hypothetical protein n=1 Tax=Frankia sp. CcI49 TaxID=1745382 RepID=UPI001056E141|nr:hypothetical protein [Frankia sp. CcI49]
MPSGAGYGLTAAPRTASPFPRAATSCCSPEETLRRFPRWDVDRAGAVRLHTSTVRGYKNLPIAA